MDTDRLLVEELALPEIPVQRRHPTDSSRILLGLMALAQTAQTGNDTNPENDPLAGVISTGVLRSLLAALHYRDIATVQHARRVALLATGMAQYLGWEGRSLKLLEVAALLHDIGKIGVPDNILFKPGKLNSDEAELMALHHNIGVDVLQAGKVDAEVLEIVVQAHSHYVLRANSSGQRGNNLHQGARILSVADAYDSLRTDQVYRKRLPHEEIVSILQDGIGVQFDGNVVAALQRWIERDGMPLASRELDDSGESAPVPAQSQDSAEATTLCQIFNYLYVLESLYDGFYLVDSDLRFVVWNLGAEKLLGHSSDQMLGQLWTSRSLIHGDRYGEPLSDRDAPMHRVISSGQPTTSTVQLRRGDGQTIEVELQSVPLMDHTGQLQGVAEIFRDLGRASSRPQEYRELKLAASRDALTSVANRGELETQLAGMVSRFSAAPKSAPLSVIFLDIDHFKSINDTWGHGVGDEVLISVARILQQEMYSGELVGRYGGEEFVVLCPDTQLDQAVRKAERLRIALSRATVCSNEDLKITSSFGVSEAEPGDSVESLLRRADKALYTSKESGRNRTTSLTNAQLLKGSPEASSNPAAEQSPFIHRTSFRACGAIDMIVYKLKGFVTDQHARLLDISTNRAVIQLGHGGLFGFWGAKDKRQPIQMEIEISQASPAAGSRGSGNHVTVKVDVRPIGWIRNSDTFQARAARAVKLLRSFFVAD